MAQVGRISGPLLFQNLERNGIDLAFRNDLQTTQLLFLDVSTGKIGIDTDSPTREVEISQKFKTINLVTDNFSTTQYSITDNTIERATGDIKLNAAEAVRFGGVFNGNAFIKHNAISTTDSNSTIDLTPNGTGAVSFLGDTNIFENLNTPGNITLEGNINFGDQITDSVDFNSDLDSDLIPDESNTYDLGKPTQRWKTVFTKLLNGESVSTTDLSAGQIDFNLRQGNIFYVAKNGNDTNHGDHIQAPFQTIKRALDAADASQQGPVSIFVFPGEYSEEFPLEVPSNVSIIGSDLRGVIVKPDALSQYEDVFLLDGDTTIENISIKDFNYKDNTGHAFRFKPGAVIQNRSPYIRNVTVITKGTETSQDDPRGFFSGDAGRGALIDGATLDPASETASMLFNSCTFITPGVDAITMTNGVRVEWLSCFVYYANRGLYAFNNSTGRVSQDGSTVKFGAEVRSISSANIYGRFGVVADGDDCVFYLIKHNFSYVGSLQRKTNDKTLAVQQNETVKTNNGEIYFTSIDHLGTYRVGDTFFANFEQGTTSITDGSITGDELTNLRLEDNGNETFIDYNNFFTGNIEVTGNLIESFQGDISFESVSPIELQDSVAVAKDLDITGNLSFDGNLNLFGNDASDTVDFNTAFDQDFVPNQDSQFDLGSNTKRWQTAYLRQAEFSDVSVNDNTITTTASNSDLELRASGTGAIAITSGVGFSNNLSVTGLSSFQDLSTTDIVISGTTEVSDSYATDSVSVDGSISVQQKVSIGSIQFDDNVISTTESNSDLELRASGSGEISLPENEAVFSQNLSVNDLSVGDVVLTGTVSLDEIDIPTGNIEINDNYIQTEISNSNLELRAQGSGAVRVDNSNTKFQQSLTVDDDSQLQDIDIQGAFQHQGDYFQTGTRSISGALQVGGTVSTAGSAQFENVEISSNTLTTTQSNSDLELRAAGTGSILVPNSDVEISQNLTIGVDFNTQNLDIVDALSVQSLQLENILINNNTIETTLSNSNLEFSAAGTGSVLLNEFFVDNNRIGTQTEVQFFNPLGDFVIDSTGALQLPAGTSDNIITEPIEVLDGGTSDDLTLTSTVDGGTSQEDDTITEVFNGDTSVVEPTGATGDIRFNTDVSLFEAFQNATVSFGGVYSDDRQTSVTADPTNNEIQFTVSSNSQGFVDATTVNLSALQIGDVNFDNNVVSTSVSNSDLDLMRVGTGEVNIGNISLTDNRIKRAADDALSFDSTALGYQKIAGSVGVVVPRGNTGERPTDPELGEIRWNTEIPILEVWDGSVFVDAGGTSQFISEEEFDDLITEYTIMFG